MTTSLDQHIRELEGWRANRRRSNYDVAVLDRAIQLARTVQAEKLKLAEKQAAEEREREQARERRRTAIMVVGLVALAWIDGWVVGKVIRGLGQ